MIIVLVILNFDILCVQQDFVTSSKHSHSISYRPPTTNNMRLLVGMTSARIFFWSKFLHIVTCIIKLLFRKCNHWSTPSGTFVRIHLFLIIITIKRAFIKYFSQLKHHSNFIHISKLMFHRMFTFCKCYWLCAIFFFKIEYFKISFFEVCY